MTHDTIHTTHDTRLTTHDTRPPDCLIKVILSTKNPVVFKFLILPEGLRISREECMYSATMAGSLRRLSKKKTFEILFRSKVFHKFLTAKHELRTYFQFLRTQLKKNLDLFKF